MSLDTTEKQQLINTHQTHGTDTGSAEVHRSYELFGVY